MQNNAWGFFTDADGAYRPTKYAVSPWSSTMLAGPCVCGLIARELENRHGDDAMVPARLTVDLFKPVRNDEIRFTTTRVRDGKRIRVADALLMQGDDVSARATVVFLRPSAQPPGEMWVREDRPEPPAETPADPETGFVFPTWFGSDAHPEGWSTNRAEHQNASRKRLWARQLPVVVGEEMSPFVRTATVGEATSLVTNWSDRGVGFINADLTLTLSRLPVGPEVGVEADHHISADGISVGTSVLFDRLGPFGSGTVTALADPHRQVDFGGA
ncbi:acyl-CoA thioesterase domain-containing protein [Rhodococcus sp. NPDC060090]|uniref:acyl-CoA thioesterase domain-containing protein n=1 Tax=Rhodococcus sp. NPDC060090 TaxID=3347056 RepID=UPI00365D4991